MIKAPPIRKPDLAAAQTAKAPAPPSRRPSPQLIHAILNRKEDERRRPARGGNASPARNAGAPQCELVVGSSNDPLQLKVDARGGYAASGACEGCCAEIAGAVQRKPGVGGGGSAGGAAGLPFALRAGLEALSGLDLSGIRVHRDSPRPAAVDAHAYTAGADIFLAPGQQHHLPHEGWHAVQQLQSRVAPMRRLDGVALNDDAGLEGEADVQGPRAQALGQMLAGGGSRTRLGASDGPADARAVAQRRARRPSPGVDVIQRIAIFVPGSVKATINLAPHFLAGMKYVGTTPPSLNGTALDVSEKSMTLAEGISLTQKAIRAPVIAGQSKADGTVTVWVEKVPVNMASFAMRLPTNGPWVLKVPKASVAAFATSEKQDVPAGCETKGETKFTVVGVPDDPTFAAVTKIHEEIHAADHKKGFAAVLGPWDANLLLAKVAKSQFSGPTLAAAEDALYVAMGGSPSEIAEKLVIDWYNRSAKFHQSKAGAEARFVSLTSEDMCKVSKLKVRH